MNIKVDRVARIVSKRYPYTHRVECELDIIDPDRVRNWLNENAIPYTQTGWGVYYLTKRDTELFLLRWV